MGNRVQVLGPVFFDVVLADLEHPPQPGREVYAGTLGIAPGGVANVAVALARLGLDVGLSAVFADDMFGEYLWTTLEGEEVDLSHSRRVRGWTTPLTAAISYEQDRSLITHERASGVDVASLLPSDYTADALVVSLTGADARWLRGVRRHGSLVFADIAWEEGGTPPEDLRAKLEHVDVFLPNAAEALALTGAADVVEAARSLAGSGVLAVITDGARGATGLDPLDGEPVHEQAPEVYVRDTTGAGDVFDAGFIYATLAGWSLRRRLRFANLCASESVRRAAGSMAAPSRAELEERWRAIDDLEESAR